MPPLFRFAGPALDGYRLLVVEDDLLIAEWVCATIRDAGGEVVGPASSVAEASRLAASEPIDCAVVDLGLEDGQAGPLIELLASEAVPVVLATGAAREDIPRAYWRFIRLPKPYDAAAIVDCALAALGQADTAMRDDRVSPASRPGD
jgi:DNA-binding response OmpR family regulator